MVAYFFFLVSAVIAANSQLEKCFDVHNFNTTDSDLVREITLKLEDKVEFTEKCLFYLLERGFFNAALEVYDQQFILKLIDSHAPNKDLKPLQDRIRKELMLQQNKLNKFLDVLNTNSIKSMQEIEPILQWGQSKDRVFIQVKFSHRIDSPACMKIKSYNVSFTQNTLVVDAIGIQEHKPIRYFLNLTFHDDILPEDSEYNMEAVGTMFVNISKAPKFELSFNSSNLWRRLSHTEFKYKIWWDLKTYYRKDMDEYAAMLEEEYRLKEEENERRIEEIRKQKRKEARAKKKAEQKAERERKKKAEEEQRRIEEEAAAKKKEEEEKAKDSQPWYKLNF